MNFTPRELEVLEAIQGGARTYHHIAKKLEPAVSHHTAEAHVRRIAEKLRELPEYSTGPPLIVAIYYAIRSEDT